MKTQVLLFFMVLSCSIIYGQRDSLYMSKLRTYQPIDTTEIDRDVEYEVVLKHYSVDEGSVIRRDTVAGYAADYLRQLILDAERDSVNLKSFLEVHFENFKNVNTEYFNIKNYLTALRNAATGRPMERQTPLEPAVEKQYIGRVITQLNSLPNTDSLIIGATYRIATFEAGDDFTSVGAQNYTGNVFVATGKYPGVWSNGSALSFAVKDTSFSTGTLDLKKFYEVFTIESGDDFSNLYKVSDSIFYHFPYDYSGDVGALYIATEQPTTWSNATVVYDKNVTPIIYKNDLGANITLYKNSDYKYIVYSDLPVFNTSEYNVDFSSMGEHCRIVPLNNNVAVIYQWTEGQFNEITLKITKFIP